jgi:hypothetical protein
VAGMTNSRQRILDFYVISKLLAVDTEVDPPQQNRPTPTESRDRPARYDIRVAAVHVVATGLMPGSYQTILKAGLFRQFRFFVGIDRLQRFEVFAA